MYQPKIGLEIHTELKSKTKMFCPSLNDPQETHPNQNICPICLGHPGTLPVANKKAIESVIKAGLALNGKPQKNFRFDRKNYFYPDLPKGYQISQYKNPIIFGGFLMIDNKKIRITRIHLEEDTARLLHDSKNKVSLVDFNRAGVPLMELVTEPDINSAHEAKKFCQELQLLLRHLGISNADMEKGEMRCEVNISLVSGGRGQKLGTKVEIKNLNSFRAVEQAIEYEIKRQTKVLEGGEKVVQETRGWNEDKKITYSQRQKEEAHDYRYFPEPDLPPFNLKDFDLEKIEREIPELPSQKRIRFNEEYGLSDNDIEILVSDRYLAEYFEEIVSELSEWLKSEALDIPKTDIIKLATNYLNTDLRNLLTENNIPIKELKITPENFAEFITLIQKGEISSKLAKIILKEMFESGAEPSEIIQEKGLVQISGEEDLGLVIDKIMSKNAKVVDEYKKGKVGALQFLIGKAMAETHGKANPQVLKDLFIKRLTNL